MTTYTTGELAKKFGVSTRTLQYYDDKGILHPAYVDENQYRVYSEREAAKLKLILILKSLSIPLKEIKALVASDETLKTVHLLLERRSAVLETKVKEQQAQIKHIKTLQRMINTESDTPIQKLADMSPIMKTNEELKPLRFKMLMIGSLGSMAWLGGLWWSTHQKTLLPVVVGTGISVGVATYLTWYYYRHVQYMCPNCQHTFIPRIKQFILAAHTPETRHLTCPSCKFTGYCAEIYQPHA
ncbi:MerR family transcriptional regulator [Staphylococcus sp. 17KM0847]|uniref:MerR family transcriptional regulator n=1 Tax=Staphylococcus sp. 17KM0847 TaxID=2583989 RepID=UPI0015DC47D2|nr:MerR family transcriptional regulator [Staphylococcus sp. 17KM0847]QLK86834.1 MerR family transcriptional regulator [Staphylococcus sp. 17KM0847]